MRRTPFFSFLFNLSDFFSPFSLHPAALWCVLLLDSFLLPQQQQQPALMRVRHKFPGVRFSLPTCPFLKTTNTVDVVLFRVGLVFFFFAQIESLATLTNRKTCFFKGGRFVPSKQLALLCFPYNLAARTSRQQQVFNDKREQRFRRRGRLLSCAFNPRRFLHWPLNPSG